MRLSLPLWSAVAARGEEEGAPSGAALEVAVSRALLGRVSSWQLSCCFAEPFISTCLLPPWLVRGFRRQASILRRWWWSGALCIFYLASLGLKAPFFEHHLDGRSKSFYIQCPSSTCPQAGKKLRQSNLHGEALTEIGYRIQYRIEGKWFCPCVHL
jgi:hypothetical protein